MKAYRPKANCDLFNFFLSNDFIIYWKMTYHRQQNFVKYRTELECKIVDKTKDKITDQDIAEK